jgi:hypothetical protein
VLEAAVLRGARALGGARSLRLERAVHALVRAVFLGRGGPDALVLDAHRSHQTLSCVSPCSPVFAKGTPSSVRMARGSP